MRAELLAALARLMSILRFEVEHGGSDGCTRTPSRVCVEGVQRGRGKNLPTALSGPIHDPHVGLRDSRMLAKRAKAP